MSNPVHAVPNVPSEQSATIARLLRRDAPRAAGSNAAPVGTSDLPACVSAFGSWERWAYDPSVHVYEVVVRCAHAWKMRVRLQDEITPETLDVVIREISRRLRRVRHA